MKAPLRGFFLVQGKDAIDDRLGSCSLQPVKNLFEVALVALTAAQNLQVIPKNSPQIRFWQDTVAHASGDQAAAACQTGKREAPTFAPQAIDGDVSAVFGGDAAHCLRQIASCGVDTLLCA